MKQKIDRAQAAVMIVDVQQAFSVPPEILGGVRAGVNAAAALNLSIRPVRSSAVASTKILGVCVQRSSIPETLGCRLICRRRRGYLDIDPLPAE